MYEVAKHQSIHVAHGYMPTTNCTCCMEEYHTKEKNDNAFNIFKKQCLPQLRFFAPQGLGYGKEGAEGADLARQRSTQVD